MKLIGYIRVSTNEQSKEGVSLAAQEADIINYCKALHHDLIEVVRDEGISGKDMNRNGLQHAILALQENKCDGLIVVKLDRLSRNLENLIWLAENIFKGRRLVSVRDHIDTSSAAGRLLFHILGSVAQWERETIAERVSDAMQHLIAKGVKMGAMPYGLMRLDERDEHGRQLIVENPKEMEAVRFVLTCRNQSKPMAYWRIAKMMNEQGIPTRNGGRWQPMTVYQIAKRGSIEP